MLHFYDPSSGFILARSFLGPILARRCEDHVASSGASFTTMEELKSWADKHAWPDIEDLPDLSEDNS